MVAPRPWKGPWSPAYMPAGDLFPTVPSERCTKGARHPATYPASKPLGYHFKATGERAMKIEWEDPGYEGSWTSQAQGNSCPRARLRGVTTPSTKNLPARDDLSAISLAPEEAPRTPTWWNRTGPGAVDGQVDVGHEAGPSGARRTPECWGGLSRPRGLHSPESTGRIRGPSSVTPPTMFGHVFPRYSSGSIRVSHSATARRTNIYGVRTVRGILRRPSGEMLGSIVTARSLRGIGASGKEATATKTAATATPSVGQRQCRWRVHHERRGVPAGIGDLAQVTMHSGKVHPPAESMRYRSAVPASWRVISVICRNIK